MVFCSCRGLLLLETYTSHCGADLQLPGFLDIEREVTGEAAFSMFNLSALPSSSSSPPHPV